MGRYALAGGLENTTVSSSPISDEKLDQGVGNIPDQKNKLGGSTTPVNLINTKEDGSEDTAADNEELTLIKGAKHYKTSYSLGKGFSAKTIVSKLHHTLNVTLDSKNVTTQFNKLVSYYNRFKVPTVNDALTRGFAHVFFVRPDCNIMNDAGTGLNKQFKNKSNFHYTWKSSPNLIKQLVADSDSSHDFSLFLSNKAASFSLSDEYINSDTYGRTYTGYKIAFGRHNIESKSSGNFTVTFQDDRNLHVYQMNKLWVDYISAVYRGECAPKTEYIRNRVLDYASAVYYIVTAEDGETIIFWSKYYGVFPTTIPSTQFAWGSGSPITYEQTKFDIQYAYSFKEDFNPVSLVEFNFNAKVKKNKTYEPTFNANYGHVGTTWVGAPYIELVVNKKSEGISDADCKYAFKLRFTHKD